MKPTEPAALQLADEHSLSCLFKLLKKNKQTNKKKTQVVFFAGTTFVAPEEATCYLVNCHSMAGLHCG